MNQTARRDLPFLPSDRPKRAPGETLWKALACHALARSNGQFETEQATAERLYGGDAGTIALLNRAAVSPANTTDSGWAAALATTAIADAITSLAPASAAAALIARGGARLDLTGRAAVNIPRWSTSLPAPAFVAEGGPIPAVQGVIGVTPLAPRKMAFLTALTSETVNSSNAEAITRVAMSDAMTGGLDAAMFSSAAADATRPAGLFLTAAITAISGGGEAALVGDIKALIAAVVAAGGGANIAFVAHPLQAATLALRSAVFPYPVFQTRGVAVGTIAAIELDAFVSGFGTEPRIESSTETLIHFESATPAAIGTAGSPNVSAAPARSAFQQDLVVIRLIQPVAWAMRGPNLAQVINGVTW